MNQKPGRSAASATAAVERLAAGGEGVCRIGGKVTFVGLTAPGDLVEVETVAERPRFRRARLLRVVRPSPDRVEPRCRVFGSCGGCCWQHLAYPAQLAAKRAIVEEALRRIGRLEPPALAPVLPSPREYGYRHRARLHAARRDGAIVFGFYASGTASVVPAANCPVLHPGLETARRELQAVATRLPAAFAACNAANALRCLSLFSHRNASFWLTRASLWGSAYP
jgi:23S rRNA (uracil1939-C5)-methyltransferase